MRGKNQVKFNKYRLKLSKRLASRGSMGAALKPLQRHGAMASRDSSLKGGLQSNSIMPTGVCSSTIITSVNLIQMLPK